MRRPFLLAPLLLTPLSCKSEVVPEPDRAPETRPASAAQAQTTSTPAQSPAPPTSRARKVTAKPTASVPASPDDPAKGEFSLADATKGLVGKGALTAVIETDLGAITCTLLDDKSPVTVANFVGLARGLRPWKSPDGAWVKKPAYDGTTFHRVVKGFMIQGGDAAGTGAGEPGYVVPDEIWDDAYHDRAGQLCMANRGPNTNGAQFFITDGPAPHLDGKYTIFGECGPIEVIHKIGAVEVKGERPASPPKIKKVIVKRVDK